MIERKTHVYLICPVRRCTPEVRAEMDGYVANLERLGYEVHYPPRDVDQSNDDGGVRICIEHLDAMLGVDEVHIWWDNESSGSHFDLGMAYMLNAVRTMLHLKLSDEDKVYLAGRDIHVGPPIRFVIANPHQVKPDPEKSFTNVLLELASRPRIVT